MLSIMQTIGLWVLVILFVATLIATIHEIILDLTIKREVDKILKEEQKKDAG